MSSDPLIRPPRQRRSQASWERVLRAGHELLAEQGYEGFTLQEVSRRAGVSIGSIYARVATKEALLVAIYDQLSADVEAELRGLEDLAADSGLTTRDLVRALVAQLARTAFRHRPVLRAFVLRGAVDPEFRARGSAGSRGLGQRFTAAVLTRRDDFAHPDPELAADAAFRMAYATIVMRFTYGEDFESARPLTDDELCRELGDAVAAYLLEQNKN